MKKPLELKKSGVVGLAVQGFETTVIVSSFINLYLE